MYRSAAGTSAIFLDVVESRQSVRYFAQVGDRVPVYASSVGRAILAQHSLEERRAIYHKIRFEQFSDTTPMTPETIETEIAAAGKRRPETAATMQRVLHRFAADLQKD